MPSVSPAIKDAFTHDLTANVVSLPTLPFDAGPSRVSEPMDALEFARKLVVKFVKLWRSLCEFAVVRETLAPFGTN